MPALDLVTSTIDLARVIGTTPGCHFDVCQLSISTVGAHGLSFRRLTEVSAEKNACCSAFLCRGAKFRFHERPIVRVGSTPA